MSSRCDPAGVRVRIPRVRIVVVNWNSGDQLGACLVSLDTLEEDGFAVESVVVVDNGSCDGSAEARNLHRHGFVAIHNAENRGFAAACNQGAMHCDADYLLFLNPDTRVFPRTVSDVVRFMSSAEAERVGICGIKLLGEGGIVQRHCARFPDWRNFVAHALGTRAIARRGPGDFLMLDFNHESSRAVDHVIGAFYFVRRELFTKLGGFCEDYFLYLEDLDCSLRARQAGWSAYYLAEAEAFHRGGGTSERIMAARLYYSLRARIIYAFKHFSPFGAFAVALATLAVEPFFRLLRGAARGSVSEVVDTLRGYWMLYTDLPGCIGRRTAYSVKYR